MSCLFRHQRYHPLCLVTNSIVKSGGKGEEKYNVLIFERLLFLTLGVETILAFGRSSSWNRRLTTCNDWQTTHNYRSRMWISYVISSMDSCRHHGVDIENIGEATCIEAVDEGMIIKCGANCILPSHLHLCPAYAALHPVRFLHSLSGRTSEYFCKLR